MDYWEGQLLIAVAQLSQFELACNIYELENESFNVKLAQE